MLGVVPCNIERNHDLQRLGSLCYCVNGNSGTGITFEAQNGNRWSLIGSAPTSCETSC